MRGEAELNTGSPALPVRLGTHQPALIRVEVSNSVVFRLTVLVAESLKSQFPACMAARWQGRESTAPGFRVVEEL